MALVTVAINTGLFALPSKMHFSQYTSPVDSSKAIIGPAHILQTSSSSQVNLSLDVMILKEELGDIPRSFLLFRVFEEIFH